MYMKPGRKAANTSSLEVSLAYVLVWTASESLLKLWGAMRDVLGVFLSGCRTGCRMAVRCTLFYHLDVRPTHIQYRRFQ
jgi:hypothetical protein